MDKGLLSFDIKTGMKNIIGRDLITDDFIAIYELVKNSYDAYADYVKITFNKDEIIIADNGKGMSMTDLKKKWFAVAYSAKKDGSEDDDIKRESHLNNLKSRRFYAGAKGVGRFSCDRLGGSLELITSKVNSDQTYKIEVDWGEFEKDAQQSFGSVQIPFEEVKIKNHFTKNSNHGTILRIRDLNSKWDAKKLLELRRSLEKLINPFSKESSFKIEIEAKEFIEADKISGKNLKINGVIDNSILKVFDLKTTQIDVKLKNSLITTKIIDRGVLIYHIEEPNLYESIIDDLEVNLYFLNRSAKVNFGKLMDIEPVNYGNVFLFKNGFRVQPYGNVGDDSWKIDNRKQQGYNRFLGTRDLFGKVDLITENFNEFKEVSSRDGGLVETSGKKILFDILYEKALKRLERYVVGVLWGEGFARRNYFLDSNIATQYRDELASDKDKDTYEEALKNLGSKIDFVNLVKTLSDDKDIKIINYNRDLVNLVNERLDIVQPKFIAELEKIAEKTNDRVLLNQIKLTEDNFNKILKDKEEAEKREAEERQKRIEAEKRAEEEEKRRLQAEEKQRKEEERRRLAELETERKEKERLQAELDKLKAEQRAKEEAERNKDLTNKLEIEKKKNEYLSSTRKTLSEDADQLVHTIDLYIGNAKTSLDTLILSEGLDDKIIEQLYTIKESIDKSIKVSELILKSNFDLKLVNQRIDIPKYIREYISTNSLAKNKINFEVRGMVSKYFSLSPLDLEISLDNLISNSQKAGAKNILIDISFEEEKLLAIYFYDDGYGVPDKFLKNPELMFDLGSRESKAKGSGIGMYDVKKRVENMKGEISFIGNGIKLKGAAFKIVL